MWHVSKLSIDKLKAYIKFTIQLFPIGGRLVYLVKTLVDQAITTSTHHVLRLPCVFSSQSDSIQLNFKDWTISRNCQIKWVSLRDQQQPASLNLLSLCYNHFYTIHLVHPVFLPLPKVSSVRLTMLLLMSLPAISLTASSHNNHGCNIPSSLSGRDTSQNDYGIKLPPRP